MTQKHFSPTDLAAALNREFDASQLGLLTRLLRDAQILPELQSARGIKANLANAMDYVQHGVPQLIRRASDRLPLLVISLESLAEAIPAEPAEPPVSLWASIHGHSAPTVVEAPMLRKFPSKPLKLPGHLNVSSKA